MTDAVIGALGTIAAAFVGVLTWYLASSADRRRERDDRDAQRRADALQRDQRVLDLVVALHSEILAGIVANRRQLTADEADYAMHQETPFATADETDFVFDSVKGDLSILPAEVIHAVVQYYRAARQSNLLTRDLRDPYFLSQTPAEKRRIIALLLQIVELQKLLGEAAIKDLADFAVAHGLDLNANERRAAALIEQARHDFKTIFKKSERLDPSLKPQARCKPPAPAS
ncbi:MAG: hypothetical protein HYX36_14880 [Rhizobiales bacterium]|nr:hypothetical protein [Hyphomicrobiales bacterium]